MPSPASFLCLAGSGLGGSGLWLTASFDKLLDDRNGAIRTASLGGEDLASLVNNKDTTGGTLGCLLEANGFDEGGARVAEQRVGQLLVGLEGSIGLGRVGGKTVNGETTRRQGLI